VQGKKDAVNKEPIDFAKAFKELPSYAEIMKRIAACMEELRQLRKLANIVRAMERADEARSGRTSK